MITSYRKIHFTYIAIFIIIVWDALKVYLHLEAPVLQLFILGSALLLGISENFNYRLLKTFFSKPVLYWLFWIVYSLFNTFLINDYNDSIGQGPFVFISSILISFLFMILIINVKGSTLDLINLLIWAFFCRLILSIVFDTSAIIGNDIAERFGASFNANSIAFGAIFLIMMVLLKTIISEKRFSFRELIMIALALVIILATGSKKTFISLIFVLIGFTFIKTSFKSISQILKAISLVAVIFLLIVFVLRYTSTGTRLLDTYSKTKDADSPESMFDNRANQYYNGWEVFMNHPINGIGLLNYPRQSKIDLVLHSEYLVQIVECGLIGSLLFVLFYYSIFKNLFRVKSNRFDLKKISSYYILSMIILFILFLGSWNYNIPMMWVFTGLSIRFIKKDSFFVKNILQVKEKISHE